MEKKKLNSFVSNIGVLFALIIIGCASVFCQNSEFSVSETYPVQPVHIQNIKLTDEFWLPIVRKVQTKTIEYALEKCREEGRLENFLIAGGRMKGETRGAMPFDDTDVYKIIEGASISLISAPNPKLEQLLDSLIEVIAIGQEEDGYLTTWRTIDPARPPATWVKVIEGKRWESLAASHEMYNPGHLYEAAYAHYMATGKRNFIEIAYRNADLMVRTFGDKEGQISTVPGHQIIETGLIKLYMASGKTEYLALAKYFLDNRGNPDNHNLFGSYSQDHVPVVDQEEVVGHAVRAMYMYAAMTDIAVLLNDSQYRQAIDDLWHNMVEKKIYITGGIGARHEGESFGDNYELPNLTAYNETCAAIGSVYWNHRMHSMTGDVKYFDIIERTLYNGLISGLSLDGTHFFYPNALESDGKYAFNRGACTRQHWFDCSCCPTNVIRFLPSVSNLIYSKSRDKNEVFVNLYASNEANIRLSSSSVNIVQETNYPWSGKVRLMINGDDNKEVAIRLRIPSWARNEVMPGELYHYDEKINKPFTVKLNGKKLEGAAVDGYFSITRKWNKKDLIELEFPMTVRKVHASQKVEENKGKVALEYGPIVYAFEEVDNKDNYSRIIIQAHQKFNVKYKSDLLEGVNTIKSDNMFAIPYYAWSNRGVNRMKVWVPFETNTR